MEVARRMNRYVIYPLPWDLFTFLDSDHYGIGSNSVHRGWPSWAQVLKGKGSI